jgi:cyanate lyase
MTSSAFSETNGKCELGEHWNMRRQELSDKIIGIKAAKGLTWSALAKAAGRSEVWTTSALLGQQAMAKEEATACGKELDLSAAT